MSCWILLPLQSGRVSARWTILAIVIDHGLSRWRTKYNCMLFCGQHHTTETFSASCTVRLSLSYIPRNNWRSKDWHFGHYGWRLLNYLERHLQQPVQTGLSCAFSTWQ
ncbi:hypothetical protein BDW75DRAFT_225205 [Aspergillus navahoensis]